MMRQPAHAGNRWSVLAGVCLSAAVGIGLHPATAGAQSNPIVIENQQPGSAGWDVDEDRIGTDAVGQIKGYASAVSVDKGQSITFRVSVNPAQTYTIDVYRIGWYQGLGGRLMQHIGPLNGVPQPTCPTNPTMGTIECQWASSYTLAVPSSWTSGIYIGAMTNAQGYKNYMTFVVRDDSRVASLLYEQPVTTYQASNHYPTGSGKSLSDWDSYGAIVPATGHKSAAKVSFDRPYYDSGIGEDFNGVTAEINFVRWIERFGYDVAYSTNVDTHANGNRLLNYRGFLSAGHDEYWSKQMFDNVAAARDAGVNLGFFGSNDIYWQIRLESSSGGVPNRVIVCYKDELLDPIGDPSLKTGLWRGTAVNRPEQTLIGVQFTASSPPQDGQGYFPSFVVSNSSHWVYAGTGFRDGDTVRGLVGPEVDRFFSQDPAPISIPGTYKLLSNSRWGTGPDDFSNSSIYQAPSGAWVYATGAMDWNWGLDDYDHGEGLPDARIQRTAANVLDRFITNAQPDFTLGASPSNQTTAPGGSTSYGVTISQTGGFTGSVTLSVSGLPAGATGSFAPNPATASSTLSVTTSPGTPNGLYSLTITGVSGSLTRTATVTLAVFPPDFALNAAPSTRTVVQGQAATYNVTITPTSGFVGQATLSVSGLPAGATASFAPNPASSSSTLTVTTNPSTTGTDTLTITGVSGSLIHTTTVSLTTTTPPAAAVAFDAVGPGSAGATVNGSSLSWSHTVSTTGSYLLLTVGVAVGKSPDTGASLAVTYDGVPMTSAGIVHSNNQPHGFVQLFYLKAPLPGAHTILVTLTGGPAVMEGGSVSFTGVDQTTPVRNITTTFGSGTSPSVTVASAPGNMVVDALATGCNGGITSSKTVRWIREVNCATAGGNGAQSTASGAASVTMGYTVPSDWWGMIGMDVVAAAAQAGPFDFTLTNEGDKSVVQGTAVTNTVTSTLSSGTAQAVTFTTSGLPAGATASYNLPSCSPNCSPTLTLSTAASTPIGPSTITVTGTAGSVSHTTTFTLNVTGPDTTAPVVGLTAPANNATVSGASVTVSATASDVIGVLGVQFQLDGNNLGAEDTTSPYSVPWNTTTAANGPHTLAAVARDAAGNTSTSSVAVTVANPVSYLPQAYTVNLGTYVSGTLASLTADDNNFLVIQSVTSGATTQSITDFQFSGVIAASRLDFSIRRKSSMATTAVVTSAYNYVTSTWTQLNSSNAGTGESTISPAITTSVAAYIGPLGNVLVRIQSSKTTIHSFSNEIVRLSATP